MLSERMRQYWVEQSIKDRVFEDFYELGKLLGRGSTASVYKCEHTGTGISWAVKIIEKNVDKKAIKTEIGN